MSSLGKSSQKSKTRSDEEYASKKKKLQPFPEDLALASNSKKLKTGTKSISKSKMSTQKKCEVTFSENIEEIKVDKELSSNCKDKENLNILDDLTPFKTTSPSKNSLKSVKEHIKTPFSKMKDGDESGENSRMNSAVGKTNQPDFSSEIVNKSLTKSSNKSAKKSSRDNTPQKSIRKLKEGRSRSKSPLVKIKEDVDQEQFDEKIQSEEKVDDKVDKFLDEKSETVILEKLVSPDNNVVSDENANKIL